MREKHQDRIISFQQGLHQWWLTHARIFPWRCDRTPYRTLVAEMMLRRTRADQVVPVFERFIETYPMLTLAAQADPDVLRGVLYPLGLSWRIDNIIELLRQASERFGDALPMDMRELCTLPGVGDYVAGAVACFAGGQPVTIIDTNVVRVLGRVFGADLHGEARRRREMRLLAAEALDRNEPANYQYALLDFAAKVCTSRSPLCAGCPLAVICHAYRQMLDTESKPLPVVGDTS